MARFEGFRIRNFRVLRDVAMGQLLSRRKSDPLTPMTAVIGKNGAGKSTMFDAFGFLADCLKVGVEEACDSQGRGGFERIRSAGETGPIEFELYYRECPTDRPITYEVAFDLDASGRPFVKRERLRQRRKGQRLGAPFSFLILEGGQGMAWKGETAGHQVKDDRPMNLLDLLAQVEKDKTESRNVERVELEDPRRLGIATLGALKQHPRIAAFRKFIEGWYLSYFTPDAARGLPLAGPQRQLSVHGDNLANVVQYMRRSEESRFAEVLKRIAAKIPGIREIKTTKSQDGRLLLEFDEQGFVDPFYAQQMSDGTLKVFAYLLLLEDPNPPPFLCIEEPENGLHHKLLEQLALEFRHHAARRKGGAQVFITTHQPYFVNALDPKEVWVLERNGDGFASVQRASDIELVRNLVAEGLPLGSLWYSDYLDAR